MDHYEFPTSGTTAKFPTIGTLHKGTITSINERQARKFGTDELDTWPNGDPKLELVIGILEDDSETYTLYAKGQMRNAIRNASQRIEVGGTLAVKYVRDGEAKKGLNAPKEYVAQYQAPTQTPIDLAEDIIHGGSTVGVATDLL